MTDKQIKQYVIKTILEGNKERIVKVMKRYMEHMKENSAFEKAREVFK